MIRRIQALNYRCLRHVDSTFDRFRVMVDPTPAARALFQAMNFVGDWQMASGSGPDAPCHRTVLRGARDDVAVGLHRVPKLGVDWSDDSAGTTIAVLGRSARRPPRRHPSSASRTAVVSARRAAVPSRAVDYMLGHSRHAANLFRPRITGLAMPSHRCEAVVGNHARG